MPFLSFIIPFRPRQNTSNFEEVSDCLIHTVNNLLSQEDGDFDIHIVGHDRPSRELPADERLHFHLSDDPVNPNREHYLLNRDRRRKVTYGCLKANEGHPEYLMPIDADDRIHPSLVRYLKDQPSADGWYLDQGYVVHVGARRCYLSDHYSELTSSSCIMAREHTWTKPFDEAAFEDCYWFLGNHKCFKEDSSKRGLTLKPVPFPAGAYFLGYTDNLSNLHRTGIIKKVRFFLRFYISGKAWQQKQKERFGPIP